MTFQVFSQEILRSCPKAVIFDTDNTLYPYEKAHREATAAAEQKAHQLLGVDLDEFRKVFAQARNEIKEQLGATASAHSRLLYFQRTIEILGMKTQLLMTLDIEQTYWRTFLYNAELFPDLKDFLLHLRSAGIGTAIITDLTSQIQFRKIIYFGLDDYFDFVVTSEESGEDKPGRKPFEIALRKLGVTPQDTWMIGDHPVADISGAHRNGMFALQKLHHGNHPQRSGDGVPDIAFEDFSRLRKLFTDQGWNS